MSMSITKRFEACLLFYTHQNIFVTIYLDDKKLYDILQALYTVFKIKMCCKKEIRDLTAVESHSINLDFFRCYKERFF